MWGGEEEEEGVGVVMDSLWLCRGREWGLEVLRGALQNSTLKES